MDLRTFIDRLHADGVDEYINLPEIAVMGDTSSGKSSLLSAIAGIELPSASEICTKCPLRLRMEKGKTESASISIKWHGSSAYKTDDSHAMKLPNWSAIPEQITRLQTIIIETSKKTVARDIIEVNVTGPNCSDLTLIDLPGIVRTRGKGEEKGLIEDVLDLIKDYLANPRCVVLAVMPANVDFHNSQIIADAAVHDPTTRRTIPVITKPDTIPAGEEAAVRDLLLGKKLDTFELGFHMIKCRGQQEMNEKVALSKGMDAEMPYFKRTEPWKSTLQTHPNLFGIVNLREKLSALQMRMISDSMPGILKEVSRKMKDAEKELRQLGDLVSTDYEKRQYYRNVVNQSLNFTRDIMSGTILGDDIFSDKSVIAAQHDKFATFAEDILSQRLANVANAELGCEVIVTLPDGSEECGKVVSISGDGLQFHIQPKTTTGTKLLTEQPKVAEKVPIVNLQTMQHAADDCAMCKGSAKGKVCFLDLEKKRWSFVIIAKDDVRCDLAWLKTLIVNNRNNDLPCFLSAALFNSVVKSFVVKDWTPLCNNLMETSRAQLQKLIADTFKKESSARYSMLDSYLQDTIAEVVDAAFKELKRSVASVLNMDCNPYTQNHYLFENINKNRNIHLKNRLVKLITRLQARAPPTPPPTQYEDAYQHQQDMYRGYSKKPPAEPAATPALTEILEFTNALFEANERKSMDDHVASEMEIILDSYGKVSAKRIIDQVPMHVLAFVRQTMSQLDMRLSSATDSTLSKLIIDSPDFAARHARAKAKFDKMTRAMEIFSGARGSI